MRFITFQEFLAAADWDTEKLKLLRKRGLIALAFGRRDAYATLPNVELDAVGAGQGAGFGRTGRFPVS
jgi:hypothetical protein